MDDTKKHHGAELPELFKEREDLLLAEYREHEQKEKTGDPKKQIGIPRVLHFHEMLPFWTAFFDRLGFELVLSDVTNPQLIYRSVENVVAETCFPVKVINGHIVDLKEKGVKKIFLPSIINMPREHPDQDENYLCPLSQAMPYLARSAFSFEEEDIEVLQPYFNFQHEEKHLIKQMERFGKSLGKSKTAIKEALAAARKAQATFESKCLERGREIMTRLGDFRQAVVILSRPYNGCDPGLNLGLPKKLHDMGVLAIPMDFLPANGDENMVRLATMYWKSGQRILAAAEQIKINPQLHGIFITCKGCENQCEIRKITFG
ncbi:acyl-CoA dehydratase activase-related protein, partial [Candidatus Zixiibacteriota bacterium]